MPLKRLNSKSEARNPKQIRNSKKQSSKVSNFEIRISIGDLLAWGYRELKVLGVREAQANTDRILEEVLKVERTHLFLNADQKAAARDVKRFRQLIARRKLRIPLAYLLKKAYFWNEVLEVGPGCLIPRPETEILVDSFIQKSGFGQNDFFTFADVGSGSGAIGIALLRHFKKARAVFLDISAGALAVTRRNVKRYGLTGRCKIIKSDLLKAVLKRPKLDAVISNPPYVAGKDWKTLEPEVLKEPHVALLGGQEGLDFYSRIALEAREVLKPGGVLGFELGWKLAKSVKNFVSKAQFHSIEIIKDYNRIDRVLLARMDEVTNGRVDDRK